MKEVKSIGETIPTILKYIGYLTSIYAFGLTIWVLSAKHTNQSNAVSVAISNMVTKKEMVHIVDSIFTAKNKPLIEAQNSLRNSYVMLVTDLHKRNNRLLTFDDFQKYMEGIEFAIQSDKIKVAVQDTMDVKIKIRKQK